MAQVLTVVIQPLNYDHKFPWHGTAEGGDDFIGQSRVTQLIKQGKKRSAAWGAAQPAQSTCSWLAVWARARAAWHKPARAFVRSCCTCSGPLQRWWWWRLCEHCLCLDKTEQHNAGG